MTAGIWEEKSVAVQYADYSFIMTRHQLKQEAPLPRAASSTDVSTSSAAAAVADVKPVAPAVQQSDDESSCKCRLIVIIAYYLFDFQMGQAVII